MNSINNNKIIYFTLVIFCIFLSFANSLYQEAINSGLVLADIINYPDSISPMKYYYYNSWTSINQFSEILLRSGFSILNSSRIILFMSLLFFSFSSFIIVSKLTSNKYLAIVTSILLLILQKNFGDTDYPSLIISNHTYGMISLGLSSLIFSLILNNSIKLASFFSTLLVCVHPVVGSWILFIIIFSLFVIKNRKLRIDFIKGAIPGFAITILSLISFYLKNIGTVDFDTTNLQLYMENWDGHRNKAGFIHFEYLIKTLALFLLVNIYFFINKTKNNLFQNFFNISI